MCMCCGYKCSHKLVQPCKQLSSVNTCMADECMIALRAYVSAARLHHKGCTIRLADAEHALQSGFSAKGLIASEYLTDAMPKSLGIGYMRSANNSMHPHGDEVENIRGARRCCCINTRPVTAKHGMLQCGLMLG